MAQKLPPHDLKPSATDKEFNMKTFNRILPFVLALVFFASGAAKLASLEFEIVAFERWGYPLWFMYLAGVIEVAGAVLLLSARTRTLASAGLAAFMIGAVGTHVIHAEWGMLVIASAIMLSAARVAWIGSLERVPASRRPGNQGDHAWLTSWN
jgi:putative oxidoreductase